MTAKWTISEKDLLSSIPGSKLKKGKSYLQYDKIGIIQEAGFIRAKFYWRGTHIFTISNQGNITNNEIYIENLTGMVELKIL